MSVQPISTTVIEVTVQPQPSTEVVLAQFGPQGPRGPAVIWVGPTAPDPTQYPLWLDTSY